MPLVAVTDYTFETLDIEKGILELLGHTVTSLKTGNDAPRLAALVQDADCVITQFAAVDAPLIAGMKRCRAIVRYGIGVDNVDLAAAAARGIPVCNVPNYCTHEVADHALAMILEMTRRTSQCDAHVKAGKWDLAVPIDQMRTLKDMTVGIVAFGRIGREVARRLVPFKCRILVTDPMVPGTLIAKEGFEAVALDELLVRADLVSLHCPSTAETRQMINARALARVKRGSLLVNVSRGTLVNTGDLVAALRSGALAGAGLDVTDPEPLPPDHPLRGMANVVISPHVAAISAAAMLKLRTSVAEIAAMVLRGAAPPNIVNGVRA